MTTVDPQPAEKAKPEPNLRSRLEAVLPSWTHWHGRLFDGATATWTTTAGTWTLSLGAMAWPKLIGPGGTWNFGSRDADHVIGVLRALGAIEGGPAQPCDALCRDVEEDRDRLTAVVESARTAARHLLDQERQHDGHGRDGHLDGDDLTPLLAALGIAATNASCL